MASRRKTSGLPLAMRMLLPDSATASIAPIGSRIRRAGTAPSHFVPYTAATNSEASAVTPSSTGKVSSALKETARRYSERSFASCSWTEDMAGSATSPTIEAIRCRGKSAVLNAIV